MCMEAVWCGLHMVQGWSSMCRVWCPPWISHARSGASLDQVQRQNAMLDLAHRASLELVQAAVCTASLRYMLHVAPIPNWPCMLDLGPVQIRPIGWPHMLEPVCKTGLVEVSYAAHTPDQYCVLCVTAFPKLASGLLIIGGPLCLCRIPMISIEF